MIIFIDTKTQNILLYRENGLVTIPFSEANDIYEYIGNKKVKYVTNVMTVGADDIVGLIGRLGVKIISPGAMSKNKYIHAIDNGTIYVDETLKFEGKFDCKLVDRELKASLQNNLLIKKLLSKGKIEIIGEVEKRKLDKEYKKMLAEKIEKEEQKEEKLSSIIMDGRVEDWDGSINVDDHNDVVAIDLDSDARGTRSKIDIGGTSVETMSELLEQLEG